MRTIAVVNQKGGCGKTTTAINLSGFLAREGRRVLLVDMDPQGHATLGLLTGADEPSKTIFDVLVADEGGARASIADVTRSAIENLDIAPADLLLSTAPARLVDVPGRETFLAEAFDETRAHYDYAIVDCPPHVGLLTFNALVACSEAIVPMDPSFFSLHGIGKLFETFKLLSEKTGHQIDARVLVTLYSGRTQFAKDVVEEMQQHLRGRYFGTIIRHSVKLAEAASHGQPIVDYCRRCAGFDDYFALATEVMQQDEAKAAHQAAAEEAEAAPCEAGDDRTSPVPPALSGPGVLFTIEAPDARRVQLVGDFNEWKLEGSEMILTDQGIWKKVLSLPAGRYRYRYVVDGSWLSDPLNSEEEPTPYGGYNSVLVLNEPTNLDQRSTINDRRPTIGGQGGAVHAV